MIDDRLGKMAADLAGVDGIRIWHDQALIKPPWGNPTGLGTWITRTGPFIRATPSASGWRWMM